MIIVLLSMFLMMQIDEGQTDTQILSGFAEESKPEVLKRLIAFRK